MGKYAHICFLPVLQKCRTSCRVFDSWPLWRWNQPRNENGWNSQLQGAREDRWTGKNGIWKSCRNYGNPKSRIIFEFWRSKQVTGGSCYELDDQQCCQKGWHKNRQFLQKVAQKVATLKNWFWTSLNPVQNRFSAGFKILHFWLLMSCFQTCLKLGLNRF